MATLPELVADVQAITDRGEDPLAVQVAIVKATLKFHLADTWQRDLVEKKITASVVEGNRVEIMISDKLAGFRKIAYLRGYDDVTDPANPTVLQDFVEQFPGSIKDGYGYRKSDIYYVAGDVLTIYCGSVPPKFLTGYYARPEVSLAKYKSWIADLYQPAIVDEACAEIFGSVGDMDEAKRRRDMFTPNLQIIRMQDIEASAR